MSALLILIPVSLILLGIAVGAFFWAVNRGQFDDLDTPPLRILEDDPPAQGDSSLTATPAETNEDQRSAETELRCHSEPSPQPSSSGDRDRG